MFEGSPILYNRACSFTGSLPELFCFTYTHSSITQYKSICTLHVIYLKYSGARVNTGQSLHIDELLQVLYLTVVGAP